MKKFKQFLKEGGNVVIDGKEAQKIDLRRIDRNQVIKILERSLVIFNAHFKRKFGKEIWKSDLLKSRKFFSGSSFHLVNRNISNDEFKQKKPTVGDIDIQIDKTLKNDIEKWLLSLSHTENYGYMKYIGFKKSSGQFITLWYIEKLGINVQIDFEFVDYENYFPTEWSRFSRSSSWEDISASIKGVFHKYLIRALTGKEIKEFSVQGKREVKTVKSNEYAFSVSSGLRKKFEPITGNENLYKELKTGESNYITDLTKIFEILFGKQPEKDDLEKMNSFVGLVDLIKKHLTRKEIDSIINAFSLILWSNKAQGLVRNDPNEDFKLKNTAFKYLMEKLGGKKPNDLDSRIKEYYRTYTSSTITT